MKQREPYQLETRMAEAFASEHGLPRSSVDALARLLAEYGDERRADGLTEAERKRTKRGRL